ncbi:hypothetical protein N7526_008488 [Penicillium atrosanguineum]|nr:hypothetical protein N7526_008488 [Penicillium atrosanguineum]
MTRFSSAQNRERPAGQKLRNISGFPYHVYGATRRVGPILAGLDFIRGDTLDRPHAGRDTLWNGLFPHLRGSGQFTSTLPARWQPLACIRGSFSLGGCPMFNQLGITWGCSLLGCLSLLMTLIPFAFIRYVNLIRSRSKFRQQVKHT